ETARWANSMAVAPSSSGTTCPWQEGQERPQPAPDPVARTIAPIRITTTLKARVTQAKRAGPEAMVPDGTAPGVRGEFCEGPSTVSVQQPSQNDCSPAGRSTRPRLFQRDDPGGGCSAETRRRLRR